MFVSLPAHMSSHLPPMWRHHRKWSLILISTSIRNPQMRVYGHESPSQSPSLFFQFPFLPIDHEQLSCKASLYDPNYPLSAYSPLLSSYKFASHKKWLSWVGCRPILLSLFASSSLTKFGGVEHLLYHGIMLGPITWNFWLFLSLTYSLVPLKIRLHVVQQARTMMKC